MIKVLLVDDHDLVRMGLRAILDDTKDISVVGEAKSGEEALSMARSEKPDVVLMDITMPGIGGLEATTKLLRIAPNTKVIAVSVHTTGPFPARLLKAGAFGYITKESEPEEMLLAIRTVLKGNKFITPQIAQTLALDQISGYSSSPLERLSSRELQIMTMITKGETVDDISQKLHLSSKTVNAHRYRIFEKLAVNSDVELTHLAIQHGLIEI